MTIQLGNLTVTVSISGRYGSETYEVTSVRDQHGDELGAVSVFLLDEIEEAVEDERMIQRYEAKMLDNDRPSLPSLLLEQGRGRCHHGPPLFHLLPCPT